MPLYEYNCDRCGTTLEVRQRFSDQPLTVHEGCGGELKKAITAAALQFKGTGWYVTDYGRNGKPVSANGSNGKSESKAEPKSDTITKTETKTETKSEAKTESKSAK